MVPSFCGAMGLAGWLAMVLVWVALIAAVVWGITRLFPDRNQTSVTPPPPQHEDEDVAPPLIDSHRR